MYIKIVNGIPEQYSIEQLLHDNSIISFPTTISHEILSNFNVFPYVDQELPAINEKYQKLIYGNYIQNDMGTWIRTWDIIQKTQEEINEWISIKQSQIRYNRNKLLAETDFYALSDVTMSPEMASYRQSLRNITSQDGFPENVIWPVKPV